MISLKILPLFFTTLSFAPRSQEVSAFQDYRAQILWQLAESPGIKQFSPESAQEFTKTRNVRSAFIHYNNCLNTIGFTYDLITYQFRSHESDLSPSEALNHFLALPFHFMDCTVTLRLAELISIKNILGDTNFNQYILETCDGILAFGAQSENHYHALTYPTPTWEMLRPHQYVYIKGCPFYTDFHPTGIFQGINALVHTVAEDPSFIYFDDAFTRPKSLSEITQDCINAQNQPLTLQDVLSIHLNAMHRPENRVPGNRLTNRIIFESLVAFNGQETLNNAVLKALTPYFNPLEKTEVYQPPEYRQNAITGLTDLEHILTLPFHSTFNSPKKQKLAVK